MLRHIGMRWLVLATLTLPAFAHPEAFTPPPSFSAHYQVERAGLTLGHSTLRFRQIAEGHYRYSVYTRATQWARWLFPSQVMEQSRGRILADGFRPDVYTYRRSGGDDDREAELRFDWQTQTVVNDIAQWPWRMSISADTIDRVISPLQLMHDLAERPREQTELTYRIADGGRLKTYQLSIETSVAVSTPHGTYQALRIRRKDSASDRETLLWCAPALGYLAVQVEQWRGDTLQARLRLARLEGL